MNSVGLCQVIWVGCEAGEVDAASLEFHNEEQIKRDESAFRPDLDGREINPNADTRFSCTAFDNGESVSSIARRGEIEAGHAEEKAQRRGLDRHPRAGHLSVRRQRSHSRTMKSRLSRMRRHTGRGHNTTGDQRWQRDLSAAGPFPRYGRTNGQNV